MLTGRHTGWKGQSRERPQRLRRAMSDRARDALEIIAAISDRDVGELHPDMDLAVDLGLDSPKALELLIAIEDHLGVRISDEEASELSSVGDVVAFVEKGAVPARR